MIAVKKKFVFTLSNCITAIRGPLALIFLFDNVFVRVLAIFLATITDYLDGYIARKRNTISTIGTILDPIMDKFFVGFIIGIFIFENRLETWQVISLFSRDIANLFFGIYLFSKGLWKKYQIRAFWCGKISTTLQLLILLLLTVQIAVPYFLYFALIFLGCLLFIFYYIDQKKLINS